MKQYDARDVIACIGSLVIPGAGQVVKRRIGRALAFFFGTAALWVVSFGALGWVGHVWAAVDALDTEIGK